MGKIGKLAGLDFPNVDEMLAAQGDRGHCEVKNADEPDLFGEEIQPLVPPVLQRLSKEQNAYYIPDINGQDAEKKRAVADELFRHIINGSAANMRFCETGESVKLAVREADGLLVGLPLDPESGLRPPCYSLLSGGRFIPVSDANELALGSEQLYWINRSGETVWFLGIGKAGAELLETAVLAGNMNKNTFEKFLARWETGEYPEIRLEFEHRGETLLYRSPVPYLLLGSHNRGTGIQLRFRYGERDVPWRSERRMTDGDDGGVYLRDLPAEERFVRRLQELIRPDMLYQRGIYADLFKEGPDQDFQINISPEEFILERGRGLLENGIEVRINDWSVRIGGELQFSIENDADLLGIRAMVSTAQGMLPVTGIPEGSSGLLEARDSYVVLRPRDLRQLEYLRRRGMDATGLLETSAINMVLIEKIYSQVLEEHESAIGHLLETSRRITNIEELSDLPPPAGLGTELRPYQLFGYRWLSLMISRNVNPCLADDMGLGKTLQTLGLLLARKETGRLGPTVIISPVVTLANWEAEFTRFAPGLRLLKHAGPGRAGSLLEMGHADVILLSYQTLRNDLPLFLEIHWDMVILDEAHYIKNIQSQIFKTVKCLKSEHRISITGTPIENNVMELFAQMDFLNPGLLGSARHFHGEFFKGIQKNGDENLLEELKELVKPFILRRTKEEVLEELPGKEILIRHVEMDAAQRDVYDLCRRQVLQELENEDDQRRKGSLVFRSLLKLRQLAIHPPLADPANRGIPSAKMEALELLMGDILAEDHKVLVFSQFTGSLKAIGGLCDRRGWKKVVLTGETRDRHREVESFQNDPRIRVFLLSLKAGGVGINLTAADYVVIFDPWWNPAAERQAIDRAHRMGQSRQVIAFKLIVRDSIEEKILELQQRKANLAEEIINGGGSFLSHLSREEMLELFR